MIFAEKGHNTFAQKIIALLFEYGLDYSELHDINQNNLKSIEKQCPRKRNLYYLETWYPNRWNFPKLDIYCRMQSEFLAEP